MAPAPTDSKTSSSDGRPSRYVTLSASYKDSSTPALITQHFSLPISAPPAGLGSGSVTDKTAYLSALRASTKQLQEEINALLTKKMEEDKMRLMTSRANGQEKEVAEKPTDEVEEENYGEEGMEDADE